MTLRSRLTWAFIAMLVVPGAVLMTLGLVLRLWWDPGGIDDPWAGGKLDRIISSVNTLLVDEPDSLLTKEGFQNLENSLGPVFDISIYRGDTKVQGNLRDNSPNSRHHYKHKPYSWFVRLSDGSKARIDLTWSPRAFSQIWGPWFLGLLLVTIFVLVLTNGVLTWLIGRSILIPLKALENSVENLSSGDLQSKIQHRGSAEFTQLANALDGLRLRLQSSLAERLTLEEERRVWVASVSHDIRTPLSVIRAYAEALQQGQPRALEKMEKYHAVILERSLHMERLVDDLFQWARWDWNEAKLNFQELNLNEELQKAKAVWLVDWPELSVELDLFPDLALFCGDTIAFRRIVDNLARNAQQHGGAGCTLKIQVYEGLAETLCVDFSNNGPPIAAEHLAHIFQRFFRGDPARNAHQGGGGLGLTIALSLTQAMGGNLTVCNPEQGGVCFTLSLPRLSPKEAR